MRMLASRIQSAVAGEVWRTCNNGCGLLLALNISYLLSKGRSGTPPLCFFLEVRMSTMTTLPPVATASKAAAGLISPACPLSDPNRSFSTGGACTQTSGSCPRCQKASSAEQQPSKAQMQSSIQEGQMPIELSNSNMLEQRI